MRTFLIAGLAALALAAIGGSVQSAGAAEVLPNVSVSSRAFTPEGYRHSPPPCLPSCLIAATAEFSVRLTNPSKEIVSVHYRTCCGTARSADPARDYQPTNGTLIFQPGQTLKQVSVPIVLDFRPEPTETFQLVLESPVNAGLDPSFNVGTGVIFNGLEQI
jgi:hypothetical protein